METEVETAPVMASGQSLVGAQLLVAPVGAQSLTPTSTRSLASHIGTRSSTGTTSKGEMILDGLVRFYKTNPQCLRALADISGQRTKISLRILEHTVTIRSKTRCIVYEIEDGPCAGEVFDMRREYKNKLRGYSKKYLDPFCRDQRLFMEFDSTTRPIFIQRGDESLYENRTDGVITTIGQLHFFQWSFTHGIIAYCFKNRESIGAEIDELDRKKKAEKAMSVEKASNGSVSSASSVDSVDSVDRVSRAKTGTGARTDAGAKAGVKTVDTVKTTDDTALSRVGSFEEVRILLEF